MLMGVLRTFHLKLGCSRRVEGAKLKRSERGRKGTSVAKWMSGREELGASQWCDSVSRIIAKAGNGRQIGGGGTAKGNHTTASVN